MDTQTIIIVGIVIVALLLFLFIKTRKTSAIEAPIDIDQLIESLGGKDNIKDVDSGPSTLKVKLKEMTIDENVIKSLGATGIVQSKDQLTMIFGKASELIADFLRQKL